MANEKRYIVNLVLAGVFLFLFLIVGGAFRVLVWPVIQGEVMESTGSQSQYQHEITLRLDGFSGYAVLRSEHFRSALRAQGVKLDLVDDAADYSARMSALGSGKAQLAVFTVDGMLAAGVDYGSQPGTIVSVLDETYGADAIVAYKAAVPDLQALDGTNASLVLTPDSPSEFLARVAIAEFGLRGIGFQEADGAGAVYDTLRKADQKKVQGYVLWEPELSRALEDPAVHRVFDSSRVSGYIVDVLVVERNFLLKHPSVVRGVVESYLRSLYHYEQQPGGLAALVAADAKAQGQSLTDAQAAAIVEGIRFRNTLENYVHFGVEPRQEGVLHLEDAIGNIAGVLQRTNKVNVDPTGGQPTALFFDGLLQEMHGAGFHPSQGLGIVSGAPKNALDGPRSAVVLPALDDKGWSQLTPAGAMQVEAISFGRGAARLHVGSQRELESLSRRLLSLPHYYLEVRGNARSDGDAAANLQLSEDRATAARDYLVSQGVPRHRVRARAMPPEGVDGAQQSVEFVLLQQPY